MTMTMLPFPGSCLTSVITTFDHLTRGFFTLVEQGENLRVKVSREFEEAGFCAITSSGFCAGPSLCRL